MPGLTLREFECTLCGRLFTLLAADLFLPAPNICDECLRNVWDLDIEALAEHVAESLAGDRWPSGEQPKPLGTGQFPVDSIVQHINWSREQWDSAEALIQARQRERGFSG